MKYSIIVADPPWEFSDKLKMSQVKRSADSNYTTLSIDKLFEIPLSEVVNDDALLCLWCPNVLLERGLSLMKSFGFEYRGLYGWVKLSKNNREDLATALKVSFDSIIKESGDWRPVADYIIALNKISFGMGRLFRGTFEVCLYGKKGSLKVLDHSQRNISIEEYNFNENNFDFDVNEKHSRKTEKLQESLDKMFPNSNKLELFARRIREGWECCGLECNNEDVFDTVRRLKNL